jgi:hypothetical protein
MKSPTIFFAVLFFWSCQQKASQNSTPIFEDGVSVGTIESKKIREASGLVESINNPTLFWTHNDSGNGAEIFLVDKSAALRTIVEIDGVENRDWEDIAVGPGPEEGKNYVYIGEIGDNNAEYEYKFIYRIEEPVINQNTADTTIVKIDQIKFRLQDGTRDTEAIIVDPKTKDLYIFSKREEKINLYKLAYPQSTTEVITAERVCKELPFTFIVAADISADGNEILIKNYDQVFYWNREGAETIEETVRRPAINLPYTPEPQGESIAFDREGKGYYTLSESKGKRPQQLLFYKRK